MRDRAGLSQFLGSEGNFTDFTYKDPDGRLTKLFLDQGFTQAKDWLASRPTYHIEVKSTKNESEEPFFMSYNQLEMVRIIPSANWC